MKHALTPPDIHKERREMQQELIKKRLKENIGKEVHIWLIADNLHYFGRVLNCDDTWVEILDYRSGNIKLNRIENIKDLSIPKVREAMK